MTADSVKIDPEALRRRCLTIPDCREILNASKTMVSFLVGEDRRALDDLARVTVFCDTGTVATARVLDGHVRHVFRRNVSSLDVVEKLVREPLQLTHIELPAEDEDDHDHDHNHSSGIVPANNRRNRHGNSSNSTSAAIYSGHRDQVKSLGTNLELIDLGLAILHAEQEKLVSHLDSVTDANPARGASTDHESPSNINNNDESVGDSSQASAHGMDFHFSLAAEHMKHADQCLRDINNMGRLVKVVSTNGKGTVFLYGNLGVAFTPAIPRPLYHKLSQLRTSKSKESRPNYVSLGTRDRYFVAFHDGTFAFKGPKGLDREIKKIKLSPRSVAFGGSYDAFFIVFHDGSWTCQGRGIPEELHEKLADRGDRPDLMCVNLGPSGEWFLRARNGRMWWGGVSDEMDEDIQQLLGAGHYLNFMNFGEDGSYFIGYD